MIVVINAELIIEKVKIIPIFVFLQSGNKKNEAEDQFEKDAKIEVKSSGNLFTHEEIESALISNALLLFFAGFDTSSTGLLYLGICVLCNSLNVLSCQIDSLDDVVASNLFIQLMQFNYTSKLLLRDIINVIKWSKWSKVIKGVGLTIFSQ